MALARALPVPGDELQSIRDGLDRQYGADIWEGEGRRVLIIRVPHDEPDPVNDVEAAVEHIRPDQLQDLTHCLLVGARAAQVYVRPMQDLMAERIALDGRVCDAMRTQLPQGLSHMTFQSPEDPRRRWRLAVRIPVPTIADMAEHHLEDLAEGIGPQLETPRFKQLVAVYLITTNDHVRLEPSIFMPEIREKWEDESRRQRAHLEIAAKMEADRQRRDDDRKRLVEELESRLERAGIDRPASTGRPVGAAPVGTQGVSTAGQDDGPAPLFEAESTFSTPAGPWTAHAEDVELELPRPGQPRRISNGPASTSPGDSPQATSPRDARPEPAGDGATARSAGDATIEAEAQRHVERRNDINHRLETLRARVDQAIGVAPSTPKTRSGRIRRKVDLEAVEEELRIGASDEVEVPDEPVGYVREDEALAVEGRQAPDARTDPKGALRHRLVNAGFEVLESPDIPGHIIDIAAERPQGDPQRIVVRFAERLDTTTAKELLKTAREMEVDMVLCVTEHPDPEGQRLLVATKVKAMRPGDVGRLAV